MFSLITLLDLKGHKADGAVQESGTGEAPAQVPATGDRRAPCGHFKFGNGIS